MVRSAMGRAIVGAAAAWMLACAGAGHAWAQEDEARSARGAPDASGAAASVQVEDSGPLGEAMIEARYDAGAAAFAAGLELLKKDPTTARQRFAEAATTWEQIAIDTGRQSGAMEYNIGNARLLAGDVGRAILAYRKAERLHAGGLGDLSANLSQARSQVRTKIDAGAENRLWHLVFFWHDHVSGRWRFDVFVIAFVFLWLWLIGRLVLKVRQSDWIEWLPRWPAAAAGVAAVVLFGSLMADAQGWFDTDAGVVLRETTGRKGPSASGYAPSFSEALSPGVEFEIIEDRGEWLFVKLADGRTTWVMRGDVGVV